MYVIHVYFSGPKTAWSGKVAPEEIIATYQIRWLWLARIKAKNVHELLDRTRCGYVITDSSGKDIEHVEVAS